MKTVTLTAVIGCSALLAIGCGSAAENVNDETAADRAAGTQQAMTSGGASANANANARNCSLEPVYFEFDSSDLSAQSRDKVQANATCAERRGMSEVTVTGMADPRGTEEYNLALGDRRARTVSGYMGSLGVTNVRAHSVGEEMASGDGESTWSRDRRAETEGR